MIQLTKCDAYFLAVTLLMFLIIGIPENQLVYTVNIIGKITNINVLYIYNKK